MNAKNSSVAISSGAINSGTDISDVDSALIPAERVALVASVLTSAAFVFWLLLRCKYGVDFSDEGFYLVWTSTPWAYDTSATQFGFLYHPLYELVGHDITLLRQVNILLTFTLAWTMCGVLLRQTPRTFPGEDSWLYVIGISAGLATTSLAFLNTWIPTPSYNTLAFQAVLITVTGLLIAGKTISTSSVTGWALIGAGVWLAFMAKPPTAVVLALVGGIYVAASGRMNFRLLAFSVLFGSVLTLLSAWAIDGSIGRFIYRLARGYEFLTRLGGGQTDIFHLSRRSLGPYARSVLSSLILVLVASSVLAMLAAHLTASADRRFRIGGAVLVVVFCLLALAMVGGLLAPMMMLTRSQRMYMLAPPIGGLFAAILIWRKSLSTLLSRDSLLQACCFAVLPLVYACGTGIGYWVKISDAVIFWVIAGVALLVFAGDRRAWRMLLPITALAQLVTVVLLYTGMEHPCRQDQALWDDTSAVQFGPWRSSLVVSGEFADYIRQLGELATGAGFKTSDPVIDLTGRSPGALFALGAKSTGQPWMIGGYSGSDDLAKAALDRVPCEELARAWILSEPAGPRRLSASVLHGYGIDVPRDFTGVGTVSAPVGAFPLRYDQVLLKPVRPAMVATTACEQLRAH